MPSLCWEVTNQATVHQWFPEQGQVVPALWSLEEGPSTWPEYATCVGVNLGDKGQIGVVAPHGLDDLFNMVVRHNPVRADLATYGRRGGIEMVGRALAVVVDRRLLKDGSVYDGSLWPILDARVRQDRTSTTV